MSDSKNGSKTNLNESNMPLLDEEQVNDKRKFRGQVDLTKNMEKLIFVLCGVITILPSPEI